MTEINIRVRISKSGKPRVASACNLKRLDRFCVSHGKALTKPQIEKLLAALAR